MQAAGKTSRIAHIDFLKALGVLCIVLAHVHPPEWLKQIRAFDVPLMVIISGCLARCTAKQTLPGISNDFRYIIKRVVRLLLPTWLFLSFFFLFNILLGNLHSIEYYVNSYLLTRYGIGYVWIVLIYLYCALWTPVFRRTQQSKYMWICMVAIYVIYELLYFLKVGIDNRLIQSTVYYFLPYGALAFIGHKFPDMSGKVKWAICIISMLLFISCSAYSVISTGFFPDVNDFKYPPRIIFLSYSTAISFFLLLLTENKSCSVFHSKAVVFLSKHSFWIYLWHIFYLSVCAAVISESHWLIQYVCVVVLSAATVWIQNKLLDIFEKHTKLRVPVFLRS